MQPSVIITNPVLRGMYPDPSWMWDAGHDRVALVNSTFELVPGLPIHVSDDLGHWSHLTDAVDEGMARRLLIPFVEDSGGLYAPTLRRIAGRYVIACTVARIDVEAARRGGATEDEIDAATRAQGNFVIVADELEGPWRGPYWIDGAEGFDPDVFEDIDGSVYWMQTRPAIVPQWEGQTELWIQRIDTEDWRLVGDGGPLADGKTVVWNGYGVDAVWAEGSHLVRVGDYAYLMSAEGGTSFEHSEMAMRVHAPRGLADAAKRFVDVLAESGESIEAPRPAERSFVGRYHRMFQANKKNPILTHRHLGLTEPVQCVGHADFIHHPRFGWWIVCLGVRETRGVEQGELLSYLGRESFIAPMVWEHNPSQWRIDSGGAANIDDGDPGWPVIAPGLGRIPGRIVMGSQAASEFGDRTDDMVVVSGGQPEGIVMDRSPFGRAQGGAVLDPSDEPTMIVRDERGVRFARIASDDTIIAVPSDGRRVTIRQNSTHYVDIAVKDSSADALGRCMTCRMADGEGTTVREYGPVPDGDDRLAVLLANNRITVFSYRDGDDVRMVADSIGSGSSTATVLCDIDARFLSTEWSGGFVGCLAGVASEV